MENTIAAIGVPINPENAAAIPDEIRVLRSSFVSNESFFPKALSTIPDTEAPI